MKEGTRKMEGLNEAFIVERRERGDIRITFN